MPKGWKRRKPKSDHIYEEDLLYVEQKECCLVIVTVTVIKEYTASDAGSEPPVIITITSI